MAVANGARRMEPIDYRSPETLAALDASTGHWDERYGCLPATLAVVVGLIGLASMAVFATAGSRTLLPVGEGCGACCLTGSWWLSILSVRRPRGTAAGVVAVAVVAVLTLLWIKVIFTPAY